jgi:dissimilatory sulfite reductase related protein
MQHMQLGGQVVEVDENGFIQDLSKWNEDIARAYAAREDVNDLIEDHWKVIYFLRSYYMANGMCPLIRRVTKETGFNLKKLYDLFPEGPANSACKWAGIPKPTGCM